MVESRGRTGRKPTSAEKKGPRQQPRSSRRGPARYAAELEKSLSRGLFAAVMLFLIMAVAFKKPAQGAILFPFVLLMYIRSATTRTTSSTRGA